MIRHIAGAAMLTAAALSTAACQGSNTGNAVQNAAARAGDVLSNAGEDVENFSRNAGDRIGNVAAKAGDVVENGFHAGVNKAREVGRDLSDGPDGNASGGR